MSVDVFRDFRARAALRAAVAADEAFLAAYEGLVKNVVLPFLHANLTEKEADDEDDEDDEDSEGEGGEEAVSYFYQYPPSVRIQPGPSDAFCRAHRDAEYGHQVGEINFWLPLTSRSAYGGGRGGGDEVGVEAEEADDEVAAEGGASQTSRSGGCGDCGGDEEWGEFKTAAVANFGGSAIRPSRSAIDNNGYSERGQEILKRLLASGDVGRAQELMKILAEKAPLPEAW